MDEQYITWVHESNHTSARWDSLATARPGPIFFWYRESPQYMLSKDDIGMVTLDEPARSVPGMRTVELDCVGRLKGLEILPDRALFLPRMVGAKLPAADFTPNCLRRRRFEQQNLKPVDADRNSADVRQCDRFAWDGVYPDNPDQKIHIEAAAFDGKPVYFNIRESWTDDADEVGIVVDPDLPTGRNIGSRRR